MSARPWYFKHAAAWLLLLGPLFYLSYGFANWWASTRTGVPSVVFTWEKHIPFIAWTIFPYWSLNVFYALAPFLGPSRRSINRLGARLVSAQLIAVSCFILWPLRFSFEQPQASGLAGNLFTALRSFDQPFNQAPSLHIVLTLILWDWYRQFIRPAWARGVLHFWAALIAISVQATYQHHFLDIPTGALLGVFCIWLWPLKHRVSVPTLWKKSAQTKRIYLALAYTSGAGTCLALSLWLGGMWLWLAWLAAALVIVGVNYWALGPRGFAMSPRGRMHWSARWLLAPYRLAAWMNSRLWAYAQPPAHEVLPGIWLGRIPNSKQWIRAGQPVIVSLCAELQTPAAARMQKLSYCLPCLDLIPLTPKQLRQAALKITCAHHHAHRSGKPLLVCCALGYSRSATALIAWLLNTQRSHSAQQAYELLHSVRKQLVVSPQVLAHLEASNSPAEAQ